MHLAIRENKLGMVKALVELGSDLERPVEDLERLTPLMLSCKSEKQLRICKYYSGLDGAVCLALIESAANGEVGWPTASVVADQIGNFMLS